MRLSKCDEVVEVAFEAEIECVVELDGDGGGSDFVGVGMSCAS